jgi:hypothetical protein
LIVEGQKRRQCAGRQENGPTPKARSPSALGTEN